MKKKVSKKAYVGESWLNIVKDDGRYEEKRFVGIDGKVGPLPFPLRCFFDRVRRVIVTAHPFSVTVIQNTCYADCHRTCSIGYITAVYSGHLSHEKEEIMRVGRLNAERMKR